jgi:hypothetical protein
MKDTSRYRKSAGLPPLPSATFRVPGGDVSCVPFGGFPAAQGLLPYKMDNIFLSRRGFEVFVVFEP